MKLSSAETELKLALPPMASDSLFSLPALKGSGPGEPKSRRIVTTYYESADKDLERQGLTLRVRQVDGQRIQTVKATGDAGVAQSRGEWEWPVESETPDLGLLKETPIADRVAGMSEGSLKPAVVTDVVRTTQTVEVEDSVVEAALDLGSIITGDKQQPVRELELELRRGKPGSIYRLALELTSIIPFEIEVESKAARGFRMKEGSPPQTHKPSSPTLDPDAPAVQGLRQIIEETLGHLLANRAAALAGDAGGVHQVRIGVRRIRS
ncbi:MAG: CYTH domain-containing protein, partial [Acetobacteraceae bacterium]|nr:CYTH domain-containing protein [Acetobacteraceae bacterium]